MVGPASKRIECNGALSVEADSATKDIQLRSKVLIGEMEDAVGGDVRWRDADAKDWVTRDCVPGNQNVAGCQNPRLEECGWM